MLEKIKQLSKMDLFKPTFWKVIFVFLVLAGMVSVIMRFALGLGIATHLSDATPWGLWIGFDVVCGVMLASGAFVIVATVNLFHLERYRPIVRPAVLTGFIGYLLVCMGLLCDLGRPWNIWHAIIFWNDRSAMFEVAWCVMLYTTMLTLEFLPMVFERFRMDKARRILHLIELPVVIVGVILSTLHQSSLGTLFVISPTKMYPLWYTPNLPYLFFVSAVCVGLGMTIVESYLSSVHLHHELDISLLTGLGKALLITLWLFAVLRLENLFHYASLDVLLHPTFETGFFLLEIIGGLVVPIVLLSIPKVRENVYGLYIAGLCTVLGFIVNRLNVSITAFERATQTAYVPKWSEFSVTAMLIAIGVAAFTLAAKYLPVFGEHSGPVPHPDVTTVLPEKKLAVIGHSAA